MIPQQLTLSNFLSYQQANLDFTGLHTACICGANGAGKSSLLEAITWALWGKTRTSYDEDVINSSAQEVQVDFRFQCNGDHYRVLRSRRRGQSAALELQVQNSNHQFQSLTAKGVKATQKKINELLKLDYDTFINSAYLRQGRADEFMMRSPTERKKVLAELLKLDQYQTLAEEAKDVSRKLKGQSEQLEQTIAPTEKELEQEKTTQQTLETVNQNYQQLQATQEKEQAQLQHLQTLDYQRQAKQQQIDWYNQQYQTITQDCEKIKQQQGKVKQSLSQLQQRIEQESDINQAYQRYLDLQQEQETLSQKFQTYQDLQQQRQQIQQQQQATINNLKLQQQRLETELENLETQEQAAQKILSQSDQINRAWNELNAARQHLQQLNQLQQEVSPLMQRRQTLQVAIEREAARQQARLEQIETSQQELQQELADVPALKSEYSAIEAQLAELEKKRNYSQRLQEKQQQQRGRQERLQQDEKNYEKQLEELRKKLELLQNPEAVCPLCERSLDHEHKQRVTDKTHHQYDSIETEKETIWEDLAKCKRELDKWSQEYEAITQELAQQEKLLARRGQIESRLDNTCDIHEKISNLNREKRAIQEALEKQTYAQDYQIELQNLEQRLAQMNYDEKNHAIAREKVEQLRYADRKAEQLEEAKKEIKRLQERKPQLETSLQDIQEKITAQEAGLTQDLQGIDQQITDLGYARSRHNEVIKAVQEAQKSQLQYQKLQEAKQDFPQKQQELTEIQEHLNKREQEKREYQEQLEALTQEMTKISDVRNEIQQLEQKIQQQRQQLDDLLSEKGKLEQKLNYLKELKTKYQNSKEELKRLKRQETIYQELSQAFGKNGIQALMIENVLPQLEAQTNKILSRLTGNQLHVQFLTQKAGKSKSKKQTKLIDTLDIIIADSQGTRAYETYSGGEGFRINFSIRLALAKLLAQRAGTALQLLIVDEGFGTQDAEGCERLIAAINAIAGDFSCILAVTHMPQFKEAFEHRIEVTKTAQGSQLTISS